MPARWGGDETRVLDASICNDTGSDIQTIYDHLFDFLNFNLNYTGPQNFGLIIGANGPSHLRRVDLELRVTNFDPALNQSIPMTGWFTERFVIRPFTPTTYLLSGNKMRRHLFFATAPGNQELYVAGRKNGLFDLLPTAWSQLAK